MRLIREENHNTIEAWNRIYKEERENNIIRTNDLIWSHFMEYISIYEHLSLIDIGCGTGGLLRYMSKHRKNLNLFGLDHSIEARKFAFEVCPDATYFDSFESIQQISFDLFHIATCSEVLEHISNNVDFMQNIISILAKNGLIITTTPYGWSDAEILHNWDYERPEDILNLTQGKCKLLESWVVTNDMCCVLQKI